MKIPYLRNLFLELGHNFEADDQIEMIAEILEESECLSERNQLKRLTDAISAVCTFAKYEELHLEYVNTKE